MDSLTHLIAPVEQADALVFDMDGTVIDSMPSHFEAWSRVALEFGLTFSRERFYQLGGVPTFQTLEILSKESNKTIDIPAAKAMKEKLYDDLIHLVEPISETVAIIKKYHGEKPMAIATGASRRNATKLLERLNLMPYFGAVVTADDVENHKPAPDVFLTAAARLSVSPEVCLAFEDTDIGLDAIRSAGMHAVDVRDYKLKF